MEHTFLLHVALLSHFISTAAFLTPNGTNLEVQALIDFKNSLSDPRGVLDDWDPNSVDPCSWLMVSCSKDNQVIHLAIPGQGLLGMISPSIGNLMQLKSVHLQDNKISGLIPPELGKVSELQEIDLSENFLTGEIPNSLSHLKSLRYLKLNNNSLTGAIPMAFRNLTHLNFLELAYNNLSGPVPRLQAKRFNVFGNPKICATGKEPDCKGTSLMPPDNVQYLRASGKPISFSIALAFGLGVICVCIMILGLGFILWWKTKHSRQIFFDFVEQTGEETCPVNLRKFQLREMQIATQNFSSKNILGKGGFGHVFRGYLQDGTAIAVKRMKDLDSMSGEIQFQAEIEITSIAVHRNLLRLYGFCTTQTERLLIYPFMPNGNVASRLKAKPALDWDSRKRIAIGTARGLVYLHEQCDPKIIHRDVKAANILLDENCEAVLGDFGLAKLLDHPDSHITTGVRGTVGHIAPEYLSTGQSSEKTDVFGFGILLVELITGQTALELGKAVNQKGAMIDWVKKIEQEKKLDKLVDEEIIHKYKKIELEGMVKIALMCTQYLPSQRPRMSEVVQMLEGDGLVERWEASQRDEATKRQANEPSFSNRDFDIRDDSLKSSSFLVQAVELSGPR